MVTLLIAMVALPIAIVGRALLNPGEERDQEREHTWPFFSASAAGPAPERLACRSRFPCASRRRAAGNSRRNTARGPACLGLDESNSGALILLVTPA
jgi:hypothetical protein